MRENAQPLFSHTRPTRALYYALGVAETHMAAFYYFNPFLMASIQDGLKVPLSPPLPHHQLHSPYSHSSTTTSSAPNMQAWSAVYFLPHVGALAVVLLLPPRQHPWSARASLAISRWAGTGHKEIKTD